MSNRKHCQDHTETAKIVAKREMMESRRRLAVKSWWADQVHQLLLIAPLLIMVIVGWLCVWLGWL